MNTLRLSAEGLLACFVDRSRYSQCGTFGFEVGRVCYISKDEGGPDRPCFLLEVQVDDEPEADR